MVYRCGAALHTVTQFLLQGKQHHIVWDNLIHSHKQLVCYILINTSVYEDIEMLQSEWQKVWPPAKTDMLFPSFLPDWKSQLPALPLTGAPHWSRILHFFSDLTDGNKTAYLTLL